MGAYPAMARKKAQKQMDEVFESVSSIERKKASISRNLKRWRTTDACSRQGADEQSQVIGARRALPGIGPARDQRDHEDFDPDQPRRRITILLTEQNIFHALNLSRHGYLLENGKIVLEGSSADLLRNEHIKKNYLGDLERREGMREVTILLTEQTWASLENGKIVLGIQCRSARNEHIKKNYFGFRKEVSMKRTGFDGVVFWVALMGTNLAPHRMSSNSG